MLTFSFTRDRNTGLEFDSSIRTILPPYAFSSHSSICDHKRLPLSKITYVGHRVLWKVLLFSPLLVCCYASLSSKLILTVKLASVSPHILHSTRKYVLIFSRCQQCSLTGWGWCVCVCVCVCVCGDDSPPWKGHCFSSMIRRLNRQTRMSSVCPARQPTHLSCHSA